MCNFYIFLSFLHKYICVCGNRIETHFEIHPSVTLIYFPFPFLSLMTLDLHVYYAANVTLKSKQASTTLSHWIRGLVEWLGDWSAKTKALHWTKLGSYISLFILNILQVIFLLNEISMHLHWLLKWNMFVYILSELKCTNLFQCATVTNTWHAPKNSAPPAARA